MPRVPLPTLLAQRASTRTAAAPSKRAPREGVTIDDRPRAPTSPMPQPGPYDMSLDVHRIALAVEACPVVAGLHGGSLGETTTYLREGRLVGIHVDHGQITIGVIGYYPASVSEIASQVRAAVAPFAPDLDVIVNVEDLHVPDPSPDPPGGRATDAPSTDQHE